jgi:hypothetical protein
VVIPGLSNITDVAMGLISSYALAADGSLWVWGDNSAGQLGLGDTTSRFFPTQLKPPPGYVFTSIDAKGNSAFATLTAMPEPATFTSLAVLCGHIVCGRRSRAGRRGLSR